MYICTYGFLFFKIMKQIYIFLLITLSFSFSFSQANKKEATLYLKNGDSIKCFARISGVNIRYAKSKKEKEKKLDYHKLKYIKYSVKGIPYKVYYQQVKGSKTPKLMQLLVDGKVQVFGVYDTYDAKPTRYANPNFERKVFPAKKYFVKKKNAKNVIRLTRNFKQEAIVFLKDCNNLVQKIKNEEKGFHRKDIINIANYYNEKCN